MHGAKSQKHVNFACDHNQRSDSIDLDVSEIQSEEDLRSRVTVMKRYLDSLKSQLDTEKTILQKEKIDLYNYTIHNQEKDAASRANSSPFRSHQTIAQFATFTNQPLPQQSRQHLRDIEQKCDTELTRLRKYVESINDLKSYWQFMKTCQVDELGEQQHSERSLRRTRRVHEGVPSGEWLNKHRTFV